MKNVIFVHGGDVMEKKEPVSAKNVRTYQWLKMMGKDAGLNMVWSSLKYFDAEKQVFTAYSQFDGENWQRITADLKPDYIFEKSVFKYERIPLKQQMAAAAPFLNPVELQTIASDKLLTYLTFPEIVYPALPVNRQSDIARGLEQITSDMIVFKPINGAGGRGVEFVQREDAMNFNIDQPYLMQAFVDASHGIPGIYDGIHDFRLLFLDNKLFHAFYRTQAPGTLMCNVTQGAQRVVVPIEEVPESMKKLAAVVQDRFKHYQNTFYSVDFIFAPNGEPKIVEINTTSGLDTAPGYDEHLKELYQNLIDHILLHV